MPNMDQDTLSKTLQILKLHLGGKDLDSAAVNSVITFLRFAIEQTPRKKVDLELFQKLDFELETFANNSTTLPESAKEQVLLTSKLIFLKLHPESRDRRSALLELFEKDQRKCLRKIFFSGLLF